MSVLRFAVGLLYSSIENPKRKEKKRQNILVMNSVLINVLSMDDSWILIIFNYFSTAHASFHQEFQSLPTD